MRICITRTVKHAYSETFIRDQINGLSKLADVHTVHSGRFPEKSENGELLSPKLYWLIHKLIKTFTGRNNYFSNYGVKRFLKSNKIDVVISNYGTSASHMVPVCKALNIPLIPIFHGHDATDKKYLSKYKTKYTKLFEYAAFIIVVSEEMKNGIINLGANPNKIKVIPCGVNPEKFQPGNEVKKDKNFLAVGRLTPKKGPLYTIKAFNKLLQVHPDATLTIVGKKDGLYEECLNLIETLNIQKSVIFTGILNQDEIADLMRSSLAFVQHSVTAPNGDMEGTPVSIMEAGASGLAIISTLHGGIKDAVIHSESGYLVQERDSEAMGDYMIEICNSPDLSLKFGEKGREHILENYNQEKQISKIYNLAVNAKKMS